MLTQCVAHMRDALEADCSQLLLAAMPGDLVKLILRLLPLDARLLAREVSRGWCALLEDASLWTHVDLSACCGVNPRLLRSGRLAMALQRKSSSGRRRSCGVKPRFLTDDRTLALLRAACVRAKGSLESLDLSGVSGGNYDEVPFVLQWLNSASVADIASLRHLVAPTTVWLKAEHVSALCRALPLCQVRCGVDSGAVDALPLLRRERPYELVTIGQLRFKKHYGQEPDAQSVFDLATALSVYKGLEKLRIYNVSLATHAVVDALVDAAISAGIKDVNFGFCGLRQTALPALGRLIQSPGFECLEVWSSCITLFEGPALPAFCEALRNCKSLKTLLLYRVNLWKDEAAGALLIAALEGLPCLQKVSLAMNRADGTPAAQRAAGDCVARLIARSNSLRKLDIACNVLGETGLALIFEAVRGSAGLTELDLRWEQISADYARDVVLPAVSANTSLRQLAIGIFGGAPLPALEEVTSILAARRQGDLAAA